MKEILEDAKGTWLLTIARYVWLDFDRLFTMVPKTILLFSTCVFVRASIYQPRQLLRRIVHAHNEQA